MQRLRIGVFACAAIIAACENGAITAPPDGKPQFSEYPVDIRFDSEEEATAYVASLPAAFVNSNAYARAGGSYVQANTVSGLPWISEITHKIFVGWHMGDRSGTFTGQPVTSLGPTHSTKELVPQVSCNDSEHGWLTEVTTHTVKYYLQVYVPIVGDWVGMFIPARPETTSHQAECDIPDGGGGGDGGGSDWDECGYEEYAEDNVNECDEDGSGGSGGGDDDGDWVDDGSIYGGTGGDTGGDSGDTGDGGSGEDYRWLCEAMNLESGAYDVYVDGEYHSTIICMVA